MQQLADDDTGTLTLGRVANAEKMMLVPHMAPAECISTIWLEPGTPDSVDWVGLFPGIGRRGVKH